MSKKLQLISLGCNKNLIDSEVMLGRLKEYEITDKSDQADVLIVNTCGFIGAAKEESLNAIFELHERRKKDSTLVVTGCLIERYKDELQRELPEVDLFTGVGNYHEIDEMIEKNESRFSPRVYLQHNEERVITGSNAHAYIKLSEGCNQKCSFCAIPSFKGKLQSRPLDEVVGEVKKLTNQGFYDFSFISQDSSSYMYDLGKKDGLLELVNEIEKVDGVKSARILYLYPSTLTNELIDKIISSDVFHNYFDMPIQHINDEMLKRMRRGANSSVIKSQFSRMRDAKDSFLRTGVIVGHPRESDEEFDEVCEFLQTFPIDRVSIFAYSDEEGTSAYDMSEKVDEDTINERIARLNAIVEHQTKKSLENELGKSLHVMLEGESSEGEFFLSGRKLSWTPEIDGEILINDSAIKNPQTGKVYEVVINELAGDKLVGEIVKEVY